jgi:hypothetical protein
MKPQLKRGGAMTENVTLDRIDFEKIVQQANAARLEYIRRHRAAALVVCSTLAIVLTLSLLFGPRTDSDQLAAAAKMQKVVTHGAPIGRH